MNRNETPEERAVRLEKHKKTTMFIMNSNFEEKVGSIGGDKFYTCLHCNKDLDSERDAMNHYFENHKGMRYGQDRERNTNGEGYNTGFEHREAFDSRQNASRHGNWKGKKKARKTWDN